MNKEEAKQLIQNGTHQIHNDCDNLELLRYILGGDIVINNKYFVKNNSWITPFGGLKTIKLSEITEEPKEWLGSEMEYFCIGNDAWRPCHAEDLKYRFKPKPNFDEEIKALQDKAKQHGMNVIVKFEKP